MTDPDHYQDKIPTAIGAKTITENRGRASIGFI